MSTEITKAVTLEILDSIRESLQTVFDQARVLDETILAERNSIARDMVRESEEIEERQKERVREERSRRAMNGGQSDE